MRTFTTYELHRAVKRDGQQQRALAAALICHRTGRKTASYDAVYALIKGINAQPMHDSGENRELIAAEGREVPSEQAWLEAHDPGIIE